MRAIADHGLYRFDLDTGTIELVPLAAALTPAERGALEQARTIRVPAADVPEFLRGHFHSVARSISVASRDGSFTPPPAPPAALVLDARFEPGDVLRLAWRWEHADGRTSPVEASVAAAAADPELDDDLLARVADELGWCRSTPSSCAVRTPPSSRPSGCRGSSTSPRPAPCASTSRGSAPTTARPPRYRR